MFNDILLSTTLYKKPYFDKEYYNPGNYKQYIIAINQATGFWKDINKVEAHIKKNYPSSIYHLDEFEPTISADEILNQISTKKTR